MKYDLIQKRALHRGFFELDAYTIEHQRFDGGSMTIEREHLERGHAVAMLLYDEQCDEVLLIEQFRIGAAVAGDSGWLIEVVAGMIDEGEDALTAACREAEEEAGYRPKRVEFLGQYYSTPGGSSEQISLYMGWIDKQEPVTSGGGLASEHEDIRRFWLPRQQAMSWITSGKINSGAPMLSLLLAFGSDGLLSRLQGES
ncbi:MAG: NUDIX domain-containing protein [Mariprofundaceae bacterium]